MTLPQWLTTVSMLWGLILGGLCWFLRRKDMAYGHWDMGFAYNRHALRARGAMSPRRKARSLNWRYQHWLINRSKVKWLQEAVLAGLLVRGCCKKVCSDSMDAVTRSPTDGSRAVNSLFSFSLQNLRDWSRSYNYNCLHKAIIEIAQWYFSLLAFRHKQRGV